MTEYDYLREHAMWDFQSEPIIPPTPAIVGIVACVGAFLGLALALEI